MTFSKKIVPQGLAWQDSLQAASQQAPMGLDQSTYARPHIVRKHLLLADKLGLVTAASSLNFTQLGELQLPDERNYLATIPSYIHRDLRRFSCPPLLISCFACLARAPLLAFPGALQMAEEKPEILRALVASCREQHGFAPSLEKLFQLAFHSELPPNFDSEGDSAGDYAP